MLMLARSTGSIWGDLLAYAAVAAILFVVSIVWQIITGGGKGGRKE